MSCELGRVADAVCWVAVQMNVPQAVLKGAMQPYFAYAQTFRGESIPMTLISCLRGEMADLCLLAFAVDGYDF